MRAIFVLVFILAAFFYSAPCISARKVLKPLDKSANVDFINMEGGGIRPAPGPVKPAQPAQPQQPKPGPAVQHASTSVVNPPNFQVAEPLKPQPKPVTANVIAPKPVQPAPPAQTLPTPGPGNVHSLINYYDSRGQASPIRPYTYSQSVKQG